MGARGIPKTTNLGKGDKSWSKSMKITFKTTISQKWPKSTKITFKTTTFQKWPKFTKKIALKTTISQKKKKVTQVHEDDTIKRIPQNEAKSSKIMLKIDNLLMEASDHTN